MSHHDKRSGEQRPREVMASLQFRAEQEREVKSALKKHGITTRYCNSGHALRTRIPLDSSEVVACDACCYDIRDQYIGGCCKVCDLHFCQQCFEQLGSKSIEALLEDARENNINHDNTPISTFSKFNNHESVISTSSSSMEGSLPSNTTMSFVSTKEFCKAGHELLQVATIERQQHLRERGGLSYMPIIECDCCSKVIGAKESIAGCCLICDVDVCKECFKNGISYDVLEDLGITDDDDDEIVEQADAAKRAYDENRQRYNRRRPTYKGAGRVNYDDYPDPTVFQWKFTGSSNSTALEYFEKDFGKELGCVLLDFYYSRGCVMTSLLHPTKGATSLFSKSHYKLSPQSYRKILKDPRSYNDRRYIEKKQKMLV